MFTVLLGPILPLIEARWSLSDAQAGYFFTAQFTGLLAGVLLTSVIIPARGFGSSFILGFLTMGIGAATMGRATWILSLGSAFLFGGGNGFITAATNLWVGETNPDGKSSALSKVNFFWTVGAVLCPFLVQRFYRSNSLMVFLAGLGCSAAVLSIGFAAIRLDTLHAHHSEEDEKPPDSRAFAFDKFALLFGLLFFAYVGTETALGGWLGVYAHRLDSASGTSWIVAPAFLWTGLLLGRGLAPKILASVREIHVVQGGAILGIAGISYLIHASNLRQVFAGSIVAGLGFAAIFPILVAWLIEYYGLAGRRVAGAMLAIAELGAASLPWLVGLVSSASGKLQAGLTILLISLAGILILSMIYGAQRTAAVNSA
jgi:fucose permease